MPDTRTVLQEIKQLIDGAFMGLGRLGQDGKFRLLLDGEIRILSTQLEKYLADLLGDYQSAPLEDLTIVREIQRKVMDGIAIFIKDQNLVTEVDAEIASGPVLTEAGWPEPKPEDQKHISSYTGVIVALLNEYWHDMLKKREYKDMPVIIAAEILDHNRLHLRFVTGEVVEVSLHKVINPSNPEFAVLLPGDLEKVGVHPVKPKSGQITEGGIEWPSNIPSAHDPDPFKKGNRG